MAFVWKIALQALKRLFLVVIIGGVLSALAACSAVKKPYVIEITEANSFFPGALVVPRGATVVWKNRDHEVHATISAPELALHVAAEDSVLGTSLWDSGDITSGETWEVTFATPGTYLYACPHHDEMVGMVVVTDDATDGVDGATVEEAP